VRREEGGKDRGVRLRLQSKKGRTCSSATGSLATKRSPSTQTGFVSVMSIFCSSASSLLSLKADETA